MWRRRWGRRLGFEAQAQETIMSGMGELHLDIYVQRMSREYGVECEVGQPSVNYSETVSHRVPQPARALQRNASRKREPNTCEGKQSK